MNLQNINLGGIADSIYQGVANSVAEIENINLHSEPGVMSVNQAMKEDALLSSLVISIVPCSDGKVYFFCENGEIYTKETGYVSVLNAGKKIMDAKEFEGYIYWTHEDHLARWKVGTDWNTSELTWGEFEDKDSDFHPLYILNAVLYMGDGHLVAQVEDNIFVPDALDLEKGQRIRSLGQARNNLAVGTYVNDNINETKIYRWNTWSRSWALSDSVPEMGINSFLAIDNAILVQAGQSGNIYAYNGSALVRHKRIPGKWSKNGRALINNNSSTIHNGIPLFGISNVVGNPVKQGIYSYGSYASNYPMILSHEHILSCGTENVEIGAIKVIDGILYASWKCGNKCGIDISSEKKKADKGVIVSRVIEPDRENLKIKRIDVYYRNLPESCDIKIYIRENTNEWRELETINDRIRNIVGTDKVKNGTFSQVKVELITHQNETPEITRIAVK